MPELALGYQDLFSTASRMRGIEVELESSRALPLGGWISYTRSLAEDEIDGRWVPRSWDQPNAAQLGGRWILGPWQAIGLYSWHSGWPDTPLQVSSPVWQNPDVVNITLAPRNSERLPSAASLDARVSWQHPLAVGFFQIALELNDLTNSRNVCCHNYSVQRAGNVSRLVDTPGYWFGFSPQLTIRWHL